MQHSIRCIGSGSLGLCSLSALGLSRLGLSGLDLCGLGLCSLCCRALVGGRRGFSASDNGFSPSPGRVRL